MKKFIVMVTAMFSAFFAFGGNGSASDIKKKIANGTASKLNIGKKDGVLRKGVGTGKGIVNGNKKLKAGGNTFGAPKATKKAAAQANKIGTREKVGPTRKRKAQ